MTNKPEKEFRIGAVKATIWKNETRNGHTRHSVYFSRVYKAGDDWKATQSFLRDDLPKLQLLAQEAYKFIFLGNKAEDDANE